MSRISARNFREFHEMKKVADEIRAIRGGSACVGHTRKVFFIISPFPTRWNLAGACAGQKKEKWNEKYVINACNLVYDCTS
jgi:hypothetical protein